VFGDAVAADGRHNEHQQSRTFSHVRSRFLQQRVQNLRPTVVAISA
jgi:hypothetical protein